IVVTSLGEEKVVSVDIFRERITLRGVEGEVRLVTLPEFKKETEELTGVGAVVTNGDEEENGAEGIAPDEISPDLLYTAEHPVFVPPANGFPPRKPNGYTPGEGAAREGEASAKRRRGRRGGRRGRGNDEPNSPGGQ
ncbi:MAG TPA: hypothetical protein VNG73_06905, partial [Gemmatimonadaceae bacterium]|nr:hypothetical protein [Gemmatimonadaceae bacterium]